MEQEENFRRFLMRGGRSSSVTDRVIRFVRGYEAYLKKFCGGKSLDQAAPSELESFVDWYEENEKRPANSQLWAIRYYYKFALNHSMERKAAELRKGRINQATFRLKDFRGINKEHANSLAKVGIHNAEQILQRGRTRMQRDELARQAGIPVQSVEEFVKLSDLARIPGIKGIRARLYYDAGIDTLEKMARWSPEELRVMLIEFVEKTGFDGIAPLPKEAESSIETARKLPKIIEL